MNDALSTEISCRLIAWYEAHRRPLPWRKTTDPYEIWISEVILQQTRVAQGTDYFHRFVARFPTVGTLAAASQDEVLKMWQGLGYYSRARNLHAAARDVVERLGGCFPCDYDTLRSLRGVGDYTAAAVASIAGGQPHAVVDGNVYRVLARLFAIDTPIDSSQGKRRFRELAGQLLDPARPALHNQAVMEFGALHCVPRQPACEECPLADLCTAHAEGRQEGLPVKGKKQAVATRWFNYLVIGCGDKVLLRQRAAGDIWQGLWEFPLLESAGPLDYGQLAGEESFRRLFEGSGEVKLLGSRTMPPHQLSHRTIRATFHRIETGAFSPAMSSAYRAVAAGELGDHAVPRLIDRYLEDEAL